VLFFVNSNSGDKMGEIWNVVLRSFLILILMFFLLKVMGKKQVSQMNFFDYITGITIGSIAADICLDIEKNLISGIVCLLIFCLVAVILSYLELKSLLMRKIINGTTVELMKDGEILVDNLAKNMITIDMLECEARVAGYFDLNDINVAILESNGKMSFLPKDKNSVVVKKDMGIKPKDKGLVYNLIIDGKIVRDNLMLANVDEKWIKHELSVKGKKIDDVMLMTVDNDKNVKIFDKVKES